MEQSNRSSADSIVALVLFAVFAAGIISVILAGAGIYRRITQSDAEMFDMRAATGYIATKVRSASSPEDVAAAKKSRNDVLRIEEEIGGERYVTCIWCEDGWLKEAFTTAEADMESITGERLMEADDVRFSIDGSLLRADVTVGGRSSYIYLDLSSGGGAP